MKLLNACAIFLCASTASAQEVNRSQLGSSFQIKYGTVTKMEKVDIQSQAPGGAVMGGIVGGATSGHHHRGKHAAEGAVAGALLSAVLEGGKKARKYTVRFNDGGLNEIITETKGIHEGNCVGVELGQTANIRLVSDVYCEHDGHEALSSPMVHAKNQEEAAECHSAKEMALQATTEEATDIALKKVRAFCEG